MAQPSMDRAAKETLPNTQTNMTVNLRNNFKVGPTDWGWALSYSTIILNKCYTVEYYN